MDAFGKEHHLCVHECLLCQSVSQSVSDLSQVLNTSNGVFKRNA